MSKKLLFICLSLFLGKAASAANETINLVPKPEKITYLKGESSYTLPLKVYLPDAQESELLGYLSNDPTFQLVAKKRSADVVLKLVGASDLPQEEGYQLLSKRGEILIEASADAGLLYGLQTVKQIVSTSDHFPHLEIEDAPRFDYRGMHLDVSRHFYPVEFIKKQLDQMALYKLNYFHWHFTDGAGWRMEVDAYPLLTEVAAWRPYDTWKEWFHGGRKYCEATDPKAQGGFYTKEDIREVIDYAAALNIEVIPEIELPAHSEEVLAVYPELSCTGEPYKHSDFCVGNEQTFTFLQTVLDEVIELFPSEYIHIGGDEAGKQAWKECAKCQARMKENDLADVDQLQSYMIRRIGQYLHGKGKKFIGWDEILQGGLAPGAIVMSWRGEEGAIEAVKMGHRAVMTPGSHCYFDAYQKDPSQEPEAIGGFLPVDKVYSYDPVPASIEKVAPELLWGVQGNVWTEYMPTPEHTEYMIYPRLVALAEVAWSSKENKNWPDFKKRLNAHYPLLQKAGINACPLDSTIRSTLTPTTDHQALKLDMQTFVYPAEIKYTLDGRTPSHSSSSYRDTIALPLQQKPIILKKQLYHQDQALGEVEVDTIFFNHAMGKDVTLHQPFNSQYPAGGKQALIDGYYGGYGYNDGRWQGYTRDMDVVIDLGEEKELSVVRAKFMQCIGPWVWFPVFVEIYTSEDGKEYKLLSRQDNDVSVEADGVLYKHFGHEGKFKTRFIRYKAENYKGFLFADEILVY